MDEVPHNLRAIIAGNIRACRNERFPGRGGVGKCALAFSRVAGMEVAPEQWSAWERGVHTPDGTLLQLIASFFGTTPADLCNKPSVLAGPLAEEEDEPTRYRNLSAPELLMAMWRDRVKAVFQVEVCVTSVRFVSRGDVEKV